MCNYCACHRDAGRLQREFEFVDPLPNVAPRFAVRPTDIEHVVAVDSDSDRTRADAVRSLSPRC